jgi:hypothetical protein
MDNIDDPLRDLSQIEANAERVVRAIGHEAVDVYGFLSEQFACGPEAGNYAFQFVYRSFYRLDSAGLTSEFKSKYFVMLEETPQSAGDRLGEPGEADSNTS